MKQLTILVMTCVLLTACASMKNMMGSDDGDAGTSKSDSSQAASSKSNSSNAKSSQVDSSKPDSSKESNDNGWTEEQKKPGIHGDIPPGSPFAKIKTGMPAKQVRDEIGTPTSQHVYSTGKSWIPFYHGDDATRMEYRYKGQGVITFNGANHGGVFQVWRVIYDPSENGYVGNK